MKQFLLLFALFSGLFISGEVMAQGCSPASGGPSNCSISASNIMVTTTQFSDNNGICTTTINLTFDLMHNNGLKWAPLYFFNGSIPAGVCGSAPSTTTNLLSFILLERTGGSNFISSAQTINGLTPSVNYSVSTTSITGGTQISITGLQLTKAGACHTAQTQFYIGADNSNKPGVACYASTTFTSYQIAISGKIDCTGPRNYDLFIDTDYQFGSVPTSISGFYEVYVDEDNDGVIDPAETQITPSTGFSTTVITPTLNRFITFDNNYGALFPNGDPRSTANLIVKVVPTTPGVAAMVGRLANTCGILPVTLQNFTAKMNNNAVALSWETADEINSKGFEIQRRVNGAASYERIGFVGSKAQAGMGASYSFTDINARNRGSVAYRLAQTDLDGKISLSEIRVVNTGSGQSQMIVYPNPSKGSVKVSLPTQLSKADISLEDFSGKTIQRWNAYSANTLQIDQIRPGIYLIRVRLQETGEQMIERLIVQ